MSVISASAELRVADCPQHQPKQSQQRDDDGSCGRKYGGEDACPLLHASGANHKCTERGQGSEQGLSVSGARISRRAPRRASRFTIRSVEEGMYVFQQSQSIIGRDEELMSLDGFLSAIEDGPIALLLDGEAGIGKTVLWDAGLTAGSMRMYRVLACRPIESETEMAYAALGDLLTDHLSDAVAELPGPQRRALEVALLLREPEKEQPARRGVAVATLGVLAALSRERPLLIGIDDVQWLDPESESVLAFVARRLRHERIGLLVARRAEAAADAPLDLAQGMPHGRFGRIRIEPLKPPELDRLVFTRLDARPSERLLERLHARSGGNPFFALEIANSILEGGALRDEGEEIPIPANLHDLVRDRLARLPPAARKATEIAAALVSADRGVRRRRHGRLDGRTRRRREGWDRRAERGARAFHPSVARLHRVRGDSSVAEAQPAWSLGRDSRRSGGARTSFGALRSKAPTLPSQPRSMRPPHGREREERPARPPTCWKHARRLTPRTRAAIARQRAMDAAARHFDAGEVDRARALLEEVMSEAPPGRERAHVLARLGWVTAHQQGFHGGAEDLPHGAGSSTATTFRSASRLRRGLAWCLARDTRATKQPRSMPAALLSWPSLSDDPAILAGALSYVAFLEALTGRESRWRRSNARSRWATRRSGRRSSAGPDWIHAMLLEWAGELTQLTTRFDSLSPSGCRTG